MLAPALRRTGHKELLSKTRKSQEGTVQGVPATSGFWGITAAEGLFLLGLFWLDLL